MTIPTNITPTSTDIENVLSEMREGRNAYANWAVDAVNPDLLPCWVDVFDPDGVQKDPCGGGHTYEEAAAAAWIGLNRRSGGLDEPVSERDYAEIPRQVPAGWQFVPYRGDK